MLWEILQYLSSVLFFFLHVQNSGSFPKALSAAEERRCLDLMAKGDRQARQKLIEHNLRLVVHIAKKYYADENDRDDLVSIGTIGLIKAIDSFKPDKGIRLSSYASRCIENATLSPTLFTCQKVLLLLQNNRNGMFWTGLQPICTSFPPFRILVCGISLYSYKLSNCTPLAKEWMPKSSICSTEAMKRSSIYMTGCAGADIIWA